MTFVFEAAEQDGFPFLAVEVWPSDRDPVRGLDFARPPGTAAYGSTLTLTFDDDQGDG